ncbi:MAG: deoxyribodipyrimidine photolyase, partial [Acidobacteriota bacterium]
ADVELSAVEIPPSITDRWPNRAASLASDGLPNLQELAIDHTVAPVDGLPGGSNAAEARMRRFVDERLDRYSDGRLDLGHRSTSGLSPYLHFGHIGPHQVFEAVAAHEGWSPGDLGVETARGQREGFWGMRPEAEGFLDELVTWRELCFSTAFRDPDFDRFESLPAWARQTLDQHAGDPRETIYDLAAFENAATHDPIWNAAQRELVDTGRIHNYLRMLWGKKILEWSPTPRDALATMIELNNKYALDGRDPNSYGGIFWCLGRYDRAWQERPIFGKIRYMSSESTRRKCTWGDYLDRFGEQRALF